jgi:alanyl-tRNA synthetase
MTGEIGPILLVGTERVRKQVRVHFVCGFRAIGHARRTHRELDAIGQMLSVSSTDAAASVRALSEELQRLRKHIDELEAKLQITKRRNCSRGMESLRRHSKTAASKH